MKKENPMKTWLPAWSAMAICAAVGVGAAFAADIPAASLKFGAGVEKTKQGFETPAAMYVVANPTNLFSNHFYYGGKVTGELKRGDRVEALAKVKGYEWVLVGKGGTGIGYVPISMLSPADQYHP
jgi:hypothetical protein